MKKITFLFLFSLIYSFSFAQTSLYQGYSNLERIERGGLKALESIIFPVKNSSNWLSLNSDIYRSSGDSLLYFFDPISGTDKPIIRIDAGGKIPLQYISDALLGAVNYKGIYSPATNTPTLPTASTSNKGWYFVTSDSGVVGGITYRSGDWIISDGVAWGKVDNTGKVTSVFGRTGAVSAQSGDYTFAQIGSKPTTVDGYGITDAVKVGTADYGGNLTIGVSTAHALFFATNNTIKMIINSAGAIYGTSITNGSFAFGTSSAPNIWRRNIADAAASFQIENQNATSTGNIADFSSNIGGTTAVRASVAKDGSVIAPNIVYKAPADYGGSLLLGTSTNNAVSITVNNNVIATFTNVGIRCSAGITHSTNLANGGLVFSSGTPTISRNLADATTTFIVDNVHASNTGLITEFKKSGATVASINNSGVISAPNIQSTIISTSTNLTLDTPGYYINEALATTFTVPTPTAARIRYKYTIINMGSESVTAAGGFEDIWEAGTLKTSISIPAGATKSIWCNGTKWIVLN